MSDARVPAVAARWISLLVRPCLDRKKNDGQELESQLQRPYPGLHILSGTEFVTVIGALLKLSSRSFAYIYHHRSSSCSTDILSPSSYELLLTDDSNNKRMEAIQAIRIMFYSDSPNCHHAEPMVMWELQKQCDELRKRYYREAITQTQMKRSSSCKKTKFTTTTTTKRPASSSAAVMVPSSVRNNVLTTTAGGSVAVTPLYNRGGVLPMASACFGQAFHAIPAPSPGRQYVTQHNSTYTAAPTVTQHHFIHSSPLNSSGPYMGGPFYNNRFANPNSSGYQQHINIMYPNTTNNTPPMLHSQPAAPVPESYSGTKRRQIAGDANANRSSGGAGTHNRTNSKKQKKSSSVRSTTTTNAANTNTNPLYYAFAQSTTSTTTNTAGSASTGSHVENFFQAYQQQRLSTDATSDGGDAETQPQNSAEADALGQLLGMGFTDPREILSSMRHLTETSAATTTTTSPSLPEQDHISDSTNTPSVEDIMCYIIQQREDMAEARMMDVARILSEETQKEESQRLQEQSEAEMEVKFHASTVEEWATNELMFPQSWILQRLLISKKVGSSADDFVGIIQKSEVGLKSKIFALLKLEKKALKWYGKDLPKVYFDCQVTERLLSTDKSDEQYLVQQIDLEITQVQKAMYELSEQVGSVPRLFRQAYDEEFKKKNNNDADDDDDEIELIIVDDDDDDDNNKHDQGNESAACNNTDRILYEE